MSCVNVQYIDGDECIGASLPKINGNFAALSAAVCELSANVPDATINVIDSPTIDLDWNASTRTLSAATTSMVATSSSPMVAKAWVNFNGTTSPGTIRSSYNVSSVTKNATGDYTVNFTTAMADANYSLSGMTNCYYGSSIGLAPENSATTVTAKTTSGFRVITRNYGTSATDMSNISIQVFGN